ncbi:MULTISPECIES: thiamine-phosphate kinase [unclassified Pseudoxanthomonas]|uniref:thiamine-phosphate kinase n=1 Tax=unclassified Pseudoxanthomonas TaxID=2645906 RepID=UPI0008E11133|nr:MULTISPECIES: thiamine-phosphate kinase [unclassified Pseudoxanthomonas]PPJ43315.1 thiamine-phosphate kinase [Pseudoxanthomonas sp. KAs_5_3]SFV34820.1 thiamine-phosphate kinase [Pseudoxanthomonas sp. YR558]
MGAGEFDLIARIRARVGTRDDIVLGIGDDAALLAPPPDRQLVVTADTLNIGVHFPEGTLPADIGWKALAVNLSDLAAMGAEPAWCTLSLSLPQSDPTWIDAFLDGFLVLAARQGIALIGGDTTRGPLSVSVTAMGLVAPGRALRRDGARVGDDVWVTGTLGDAAGGLAHLERPSSLLLRGRLDRPTPRVDAGRALVGIATACVDVSDGLLADLGHVCARSNVGARVDVEALPASDALRNAVSEADRIALQAGGGDDYELCFTAPIEERERILALASQLDLPMTRIGYIVEGEAVQALRRDGQPWQPVRRGYDHFDSV